MTPKQWSHVTELFARGEGLSEGERQELLSSECPNDHSIQKQLLQLWSDWEKAEGFLESPIIAPPAPSGDGPLLKGGQVLAGRFTVQELIGAGGMGEVYRARDERLGRIVAVKVLSKHLEKDYRKRLEREARVISSLSHPRVCALHDIGLEGERLFLVMEYLAGETLACRLPRGPLPMPELLSLADQILEGLEYAHRNQVVHCDLKPGNILLTEAGVKILDFGIAKRVRKGEAPGTSGDASTDLGQLLGTVAYTSPEQLLGREIDERSDMFSVGVVLYEMSTGHRPFTGSTATEVMDKVLNASPEPITRFRSDAGTLDPIVSKCLQKDKEERYSSAQALREELRLLANDAALPAAVTEPVTPRPQLRRDMPSPVQLARQLAPKLIVGILVLVVAAIAAIRTRETKVTSGGPSSIAILPFETPADDREADLLAEGLADEIRGKLAQLNGVRVVARTSSLQFKGQALDVREIGRKVGVESVLEGSIRRISGGLRVMAQLNDAGSGFQLWSGIYSADGNEVPGLREQIARQVAGRLNGAPALRSRTYTPGKKAYHAVMRGRYHLHRRTGNDVRKALGEFEKAVRLEPGYPEAHAGLAEAWFLGENYIPIPSTEAMPKAKAAAMKALALDETLADAHAVLANVSYMWDWDWKSAGTAFRRAIELQPSDPLVHDWYGDYLLALRRFDDCLRERQAAEALDPVSPILQVAHGLTLEYMGRYSEARQRLESVLELDPQFQAAYIFLARAQALGGDTKSALRTLERARSIFGDLENIRWNIAKTLAMAGRDNEARETMAAIVHQQGRRPLWMARIHIDLGEHSKALDLIDESIHQRRASVALLAVRTDYNPLRGNPRFQTMLHSMNLE